MLLLTCGAGILHGAFSGGNIMCSALDFVLPGAFCALLSGWSLGNIKGR
ncbi:MAG: hypothetical protein R6X07_10045 [Desulfatiglandales bacterium]